MIIKCTNDTIKLNKTNYNNTTTILIIIIIYWQKSKRRSLKWQMKLPYRCTD